MLGWLSQLFVPVTLQEGDLTTQYAKGPAEDLGLLKMDFLGLKTLTVISDAETSVRRLDEMADFDIEKITLCLARRKSISESVKMGGVTVNNMADFLCALKKMIMSREISLGQWSRTSTRSKE